MNYVSLLPCQMLVSVHCFCLLSIYIIGVLAEKENLEKQLLSVEKSMNALIKKLKTGY